MEASILYFDQFELDLNSYELRKSGRVIKLEKLSTELLILLAEKQGQLVTREEIIQRLWGDNVFVDTRQGINTAVRKIRVALQDDPEHSRLLQTVAGRGYRLLAPVSADDEDTAEQTAPQIPLPPPLPTLEFTHIEQRWSSPAGKPPGDLPAKAPPVAPIIGVFVTLLAIVSLVVILVHWHRTGAPSTGAWVQITNFSDSATQPALSPDGRMIAFIRGPETFVTPGQIYVKILPDGEPVQLTHDDLPKMAPAFSPDGSRIAYTTTDRRFGWNTWVVPVLGGEPMELLPNAAALTWADDHHVVYSEIKTGVHMGIATAAESRAGERDVYLPASVHGMAHRSWVSPDGKWVLTSEMTDDGWRCRVLPFDGSTSGETAGPKAANCTYAGWSPDGGIMYFSADAGDGYHIWRQRFPSGVLEQMTFGPTEEEGIAVSPDGNTLVTSAGIRESTVWLHDPRGDRQISGEGFASVPGLGYGGGRGARSVFSPDGKRLFYLVYKQGSRAFNSSGELWMTDLDSGRTDPVLPGISMSEFDIAPDGERVAFEAQDAQGMSRAWIAPLDRRTPPKQITSSVSTEIIFGPGEVIYFVALEGGQEFLYRLGNGETIPRKVSPQPLQYLAGISPHGDWLLWFNDGVTARPLGTC